MEDNELFLKYLIDEKIYIVDNEDTAGASRSAAKVGTPELSGVAAKVESAEAGKAMEADHNKDVDRSGDTDPTALVSKSDDIEDTGDASRSDDTEGTTKGSSSVEGEDTAVPGISGDNKPVKKYKDKTVLLLDYNDQASMPAGHMDLLAKILQSVNLNLESVEMVFRDEFEKLEVKGFSDCAVIAFLNRVPEQINALFAVEKYMINIINGNQSVACDTFNDLIKDRTLKRKLWEQLKLIYGI